jgi:hypothetical protein
MGRVGVPQGREGGLWGATTLAPHRGERLWAGGGGQGRGPVPGGEPPGAGPPARPVRSSPRPGPCGQRSIAVWAPWALADPDPPAWGLEGRARPRGPLPAAQPPRVDQPPTQPGGRVLDHGQKVPPCPRTPHDGQLLAVPGAHEVEAWPRSLARQLGDAPDPVEVATAGALGDVLLREPGQALLAERRVAALVGRASVGWRQLVHSGDITRLGRGGKPPTRQVFTPAASTCGQGHPPVRVAHEPSQTVDTHRQRDRRSP